jgi:heat shock protein HslJ
MLINPLVFFRRYLQASAKDCLTIVALTGLVVLTGCQSSPSASGAKNTRIVAHPERPIQTSVPIQQLTPLQGTTWQMIEIKGRVAQIYSERPWLQFSNQTNQIEGSTGCNRLWGDYTLGTAQAIKLRGFNGQQNCTGALVQEANLLDAFDQTVSYKLDAAGLVLIDANQNVLLRATATQPK